MKQTNGARLETLEITAILSFIAIFAFIVYSVFSTNKYTRRAYDRNVQACYAAGYPDTRGDGKYCVKRVDCTDYIISVDSLR